MTPRTAAKYGYRLISMPYSIDGVTYYPYKDTDEEFDFHGYYEKLRDGVLPTTSAISEQQYIEYFEPEFAAGNDILYVHFSAAMTMTFDAMHKALKTLAEKYPDRKFYEIDTKGISIIGFAIANEVGEMVLAGKTVEEILKWAETEVDHYAVYFFADNLKFFRRSGRVSGLAATMGGLIGLRPIIFMNAEGKMVSIGTEKGRAKAMERLANTAVEIGDDVPSYKVYIAQADCPDLAEQVAELLQERFGGNLDIDIEYVNPTAGAHCGPDSMGVCFHSKRR